MNEGHDIQFVGYVLFCVPKCIREREFILIKTPHRIVNEIIVGGRNEVTGKFYECHKEVWH